MVKTCNFLAVDGTVLINRAVLWFFGFFFFFLSLPFSVASECILVLSFSLFLVLLILSFSYSSWHLFSPSSVLSKVFHPSPVKVVGKLKPRLHAGLSLISDRYELHVLAPKLI